MSRPYAEIAQTYADDILTGAIPACQWVKLACRRFQADIEAGKWTYDIAKGERVCTFVELLPHTKDRWAAKRELIVLQPWQIFILMSAFSFLDPATGYRRFNSVMIVVPRKSGKSLMSAAVGLYMMLADSEYGAEVYCGSSTERQSWEVFKPAMLMVKNTPALAKRFGITVGARTLSVERDGSLFHPLIGKPGDGSSPHLAILDERHEHEDNVLHDAMRTGMGTRSQPMMWTITTAGFDLASPCYDDVMAGRKILDGTLDSDRRFYLEYSIDADDDWTSVESLKKANPNFGISVNETFLMGELADAINIASKQTAYKTKFLCVWCQAKDAFHNLMKWNLNYRADIKLEDYKGRSVIIACDLAAKQDIAATMILVPLDDGTFVLFGHYYLPSDAVTAPGRNHYAAWRDNHLIDVCDGNMNDFDAIEEDIDSLVHDFDVQKIIIDSRLASMMEQHLISKGYPVEAFVPSAVNYTEPMRWLNGLINDGKVLHNSAPSDPLTWMFGNVVSKPNRRDMEFPDKERSESKIDGAVATYMAVAAYLSTPQATDIQSLFM